MPDLHELTLLIRSRHPCITIETVEEERAERLARQACGDLHLPFFVWTVAEGLRRVLPAPQRYAPETARPAQALAQIGLGEPAAVYLLKDVIAHLKDETVARLLRDLAGRLTQ